MSAKNSRRTPDSVSLTDSVEGWSTETSGPPYAIAGICYNKLYMSDRYCGRVFTMMHLCDRVYYGCEPLLLVLQGYDAQRGLYACLSEGDLHLKMFMSVQLLVP